MGDAHHPKGTIEVANRGVSTCGDTEQFVEIDARRYDECIRQGVVGVELPAVALGDGHDDVESCEGSALEFPQFRVLPAPQRFQHRIGGGLGKEGLGLGLATVKKLVEGHDGAVGVTSVRGEGSTFWFSLRRAGAAWQSQEASSADRVETERELGH